VTFKDWGQTGCLKCSIGIVPYVLSIQDVEVSKLICGTLLAKTTRKKDPANTEGCQERYDGGKMACGVRRSDPIAAMPAATYMSVRKSLFYTLCKGMGGQDSNPRVPGTRELLPTGPSSTYGYVFFNAFILWNNEAVVHYT
jgi:hypothetical protein